MSRRDYKYSMENNQIIGYWYTKLYVVVHLMDKQTKYQLMS